MLYGTKYLFYEQNTYADRTEYICYIEQITYAICNG